MKLSKMIVIGGSAGSLSMLIKIISVLKKDMNVSVLIVLHRKPSEDNVLLDVLKSRTDFKVGEAEDKDQLTRGSMFVAPADYHVLIEREGCITLDDSEKVNFSRPSIDVSFESAAEVFGSSLVCVLLSGANADGVFGMIKAKQNGASIVIQDPKSAEFAYMPNQAMENVKADLVLSEDNLNALAELLYD